MYTENTGEWMVRTGLDKELLKLHKTGRSKMDGRNVNSKPEDDDTVILSDFWNRGLTGAQREALDWALGEMADEEMFTPALRSPAYELLTDMLQVVLNSHDMMEDINYRLNVQYVELIDKRRDMSAETKESVKAAAVNAFVQLVQIRKGLRIHCQHRGIYTLVIDGKNTCSVCNEGFEDAGAVDEIVRSLGLLGNFVGNGSIEEAINMINAIDNSGMVGFAKMNELKGWLWDLEKIQYTISSIHGSVYNMIYDYEESIGNPKITDHGTGSQ